MAHENKISEACKRGDHELCKGVCDEGYDPDDNQPDCLCECGHPEEFHESKKPTPKY